jgi:hypothetical protein
VIGRVVLRGGGEHAAVDLDVHLRRLGQVGLQIFPREELPVHLERQPELHRELGRQ